MEPLGLTAAQLSAPMEGPKRILTIEGGGVRGVFTLQILRQMEQELRTHYKRPEMVLADHFHLVAGTSVGAILATFLSLGWSVDRLSVLFDASLKPIFSRARWWKLGGAAFRRGPLREILQREFTEADGTPSLFGTRRLKTWLLVVVRNLSTGSAWPLLNHPESLFNRLTQPDGTDHRGSNLRIPLWQLVRGSTAAPWFFPPERVTLEPGETVEFIDGGITAYNNPSVVAVMMATLPCFPLQWKKGVEHLQVVSVGTGRCRTLLSLKQRWRFGRLGLAGKVPAGLIESTAQAQDLVMRTMGRCVYGPPVDSEIGTLMDGHASVGDFRYCRYNRDFTAQEISQACTDLRTKFSLSAIKLAPWLREQGQSYAREAVKIEHLI
ncbi:MAG: patatin [Verrucomicrobiaceae bacterium]|nr:patatin [Verrucomicrobiaceae bacterium]